MKTKLLKEIKKQILAKPTRLYMPLWVKTHDHVSDCGTTACIAGWACVIDTQKKFEAKKKLQLPFEQAVRELTGKVTPHDARKLLGLTETQASRLFFQANWPLKFHTAFSASPYRTIEGREARAKVAAERISHFIATKGRE